MKISTKLIVAAVFAVATLQTTQANVFKRLAQRMYKPAKFATVAAAGYGAYTYHPQLFAHPYFVQRKAQRDAAIAAQYPDAKGTPAQIAAAVRSTPSCKEMRAAAKDLGHNFVNTFPQSWRTAAQTNYNQLPAQATKYKEQAQTWLGVKRVLAANWLNTFKAKQEIKAPVTQKRAPAQSAVDGKPFLYGAQSPTQPVVPSTTVPVAPGK